MQKKNMNLQQTAKEMLEKSQKDLEQNLIALQFAEWQVEKEENEEKKKQKNEEVNKIRAQVELITTSIANFTEFLPELK